MLPAHCPEEFGCAQAPRFTLTVSVIAAGFSTGVPAPPAMTVDDVQVAVVEPMTVAAQFQPLPVGIAATVMPVGSVSTTV